MSQPRASTSGSAAAAAGGAAAELSTAAAGGMAVAPPTSSPASTSSRKNDETLTRATGTSDSWAMESSIDLCRRASSGRRGRPQFCFTPPWKFRRERRGGRRELRQLVKRAHLARRGRLLPPLPSPHLRRRSFLGPTWRASTPATSRTASSTASASACTWTARGTRATGSRASRAAAARTRLPAVRAPPPQFCRRRRRLTSPRAAPQATNSRASGRMGGCTGSACTPGKLATSTSAR